MISGGGWKVGTNPYPPCSCPCFSGPTFPAADPRITLATGPARWKGLKAPATFERRQCPDGSLRPMLGQLAHQRPKLLEAVQQNPLFPPSQQPCAIHHLSQLVLCVHPLDCPGPSFEDPPLNRASPASRLAFSAAAPTLPRQIPAPQPTTSAHPLPPGRFPAAIAIPVHDPCLQRLRCRGLKSGGPR